MYQDSPKVKTQIHTEDKATFSKRRDVDVVGIDESVVFTKGFGECFFNAPIAFRDEVGRGGLSHQDAILVCEKDITKNDWDGYF